MPTPYNIRHLFGMLSIWLVACTNQPAGQSQSKLDIPPTSSVVQKKLILQEGTNMAAALSPDETTLVIALQGVLWTLPAAGGTATAITSPELDAHEPYWAPDGNSIVFYAYQSDGFAIWTVNKDGSQLQRLIKVKGDARYPSYSSTGNEILYSSDASASGYQAWSYDVTSQAKTVLTHSEETGYSTPTAPYFFGDGNVVYPTLSPDGQWIAYVIDGKEDALVVRHRAPSSQATILHRANLLGAPTWTPDGNNLVIVGLNGQQGQLVSVEAPHSNHSVRVLVDSGDIFPFRPSVNSSNTVIYTADGKIKQVTLDGKNKPSIPFAAAVTLNRQIYQRRTYDFTDTQPRQALGIINPIISNQGDKAIFTALGDLWIAALPDGQPRQLTNDEFVDMSPSWSPDGKSIAFVSDRGGKSNVWIMNLETGLLEQLTHSATPVSEPSWSPDGKHIAYLTDAMLTVFFAATVNVIEVQSKKTATLSGPLFGPSAPAWSPDGTKVAIVYRQPFTNRFREGINVIHLLPISADEDKSWFSPTPGKSLGRRQWSRLAWSSQGALVYRVDGQLWQAQVTSNGEIIDTPTLIAERGENPSWSANGDSLIYLDGANIKMYSTKQRTTHNLTISPTWSPHLSSTALTLRAGRVFNGIDDDYVENVDIRIRNGVIESIAPIDELPPIGQLIDASDQVVIPGLIEHHTHQSSNLGVKLGMKWLSHGITSVRETGDDPYHAVERREAAASGKRKSPRVFTAGPLNEGKRLSYGVSETVENITRAKSSMALSNALQLDMYKSYVRQDYEVQQAVISMAHAQGIPVSSHELYPSVANGIDNIEHFGATSRRGYSLKQSRTGKSYQDVISLISESQVVITPTLLLASRNRTQPIEGQMAMLMDVVNAGGNIVAGTDSPFVPFGLSLHQELMIYVDADMSPAQALKTATSNAADALGVGNQLGRIMPGGNRRPGDSQRRPTKRYYTNAQYFCCAKKWRNCLFDPLRDVDFTSSLRKVSDLAST